MLSWLSHASALHWPFGSRDWKNKLRRKGQEQRTTSSDTEERRADVLLAAWAFALIMDVWCRPLTCRLFFFPHLSLTLECGGTVSDLCQVNRKDMRNPYAVDAPHFSLMSTSTRPHTTHINLLTGPSILSLSDTDTHHLWRLRVEDSPAGSAEWQGTDGGVQRPPVPKLYLSTAHLHRWGERYAATTAIRALQNITLTEMHVWASAPNVPLIVWNFFLVTPEQLLSQSANLQDEPVEAEMHNCWSVFLTISKPVVTKRSSLTHRILESLLLWRPLVL